MQELSTLIQGSLPLLEHLDFVFVEYLDKMNHFEGCHVLFVFSDCAFNNSLFLQSFCKFYLSILSENPYVEKGIMKPTNLLNFLQALSKSKNFSGEKLVWRLLELQMMKYEVIEKLSLEQIVKLIQIFGERRIGSVEFWDILTAAFYV